jgi:sugar phosphate permease
MNGWQARIFAITWLSYAGFYFCRKNFSVMMPLLSRDEGFSTAAFAGAISIYSLFYCLGQFSSGLLSDRLGARRVVTFGMLLSAAASAAMAWLAEPLPITILQAVNGFAQACGWPGLLKIMTYWFDSKSRGVVMAWWGTNYVAGGFLATLFATAAATGPVLVAMGWRRAAIAPALVVVVIAVLFWLLVREAPPQDAAVPREAAVGASAFAGLGEVMANPAIQTIAAMYFSIKLVRYVLLFWLPLYMTQRLAYTAGEAGYTSAAFELAGFGGVLLSGYLSDQWMGGRRFPVGALMMFGLSMACFLHPMVASSGRWANIIGIGVIGALTFGPDVLMAGAGTVDVVRRQVAATAAGYVNGVGTLGQAISPWLASYVAEQFGWDRVFQTLAVFALLGGMVLTTQWSHRKAYAAS